MIVIDGQNRVRSPTGGGVFVLVNEVFKVGLLGEQRPGPEPGR
ncbi:hypothetical protein [Actinosynnema sp. NPDC020468]